MIGSKGRPTRKAIFEVMTGLTPEEYLTNPNSDRIVREIMVGEMQEAARWKVGATIASYDAQGRITWECPLINIYQSMKPKIDSASLPKLKWLIK